MASDRQTVYVLANRGNSLFMHWFGYVLSGLHDLAHLPKPIKFHTDVTLDFQRETLPLLKPDFEFVENISGYNVQHYEGAPCKTTYSVEDYYYHFVRNQILLIRLNLKINISCIKVIVLEEYAHF